MSLNMKNYMIEEEYITEPDNDILYKTLKQSVYFCINFLDDGS